MIFFKELPAPIIDDPGPPPEDATNQSDEHMKIAWRYQHLPKYQVNLRQQTLSF